MTLELRGAKPPALSKSRQRLRLSDAQRRHLHRMLTGLSRQMDCILGSVRQTGEMGLQYGINRECIIDTNVGSTSIFCIP